MANPGQHIQSEYALSVARTALVSIVRERTDDGAGYEAIERSGCEALLDILTRYIRTVGSASSSATRHAGRSESNYADVRLGLEAVRGSSAPSLLAFMQQIPEEVLPQNVAAFPVPWRATQMPPLRPAGPRHTKPMEYMPDYLPAFPDPCTYKRTGATRKMCQQQAN